MGRQQSLSRWYLTFLMSVLPLVYHVTDSLERVFLPSVSNNPVHTAQVLWEELLYRFIVCVFPSLFTAAQAQDR